MGGSVLNIKKSPNQNEDYFEILGCLEFQIFPKLKLLKYGLEFDDIGEIKAIFGI